MDQVGKLDRILYEEHGNVVTDDVPVALARIQLDGKAPHITRQIGRALVTGHGRESDECRSFLARSLQQVRACNVCKRFISLEVTVCAETARVHHPLGNSFVIEVKQLLPEVEVLQ